MYREIKKKKLILENRKPFSKEAVQLIAEINRVDWIYSSLKLDGYSVSRSEVEEIQKGRFLTEVSVKEHAVISNYKDVIDLIYQMIGMDTCLDEDIMLKLHKVLTEGSGEGYRKSNPVLRNLSYNPPHFKEIELQMEILFAWFRSDEYQLNPIEKAACLHNKLVEVYPYESMSEACARIAAQYHLISCGLPPVLWNLSEQEYYDGLKSYLKKEDIRPIYSMLERAVFNKLEIMMQLTAR